MQADQSFPQPPTEPQDKIILFQQVKIIQTKLTLHCRKQDKTGPVSEASSLPLTRTTQGRTNGVHHHAQERIALPAPQARTSLHP